MIYQEFTLVPQLTAPRTSSSATSRRARGFIDDARRRRAREEGARRARLRLPLDVPTVAAFGRPAANRRNCQGAWRRHARIIVMDEPTAALSDREIERCSRHPRLKAGGVAIVYISHRMEELPRIADRITVLRDGRAVETRPARTTFQPTRSFARWSGRTARRALSGACRS